MALRGKAGAQGRQYPVFLSPCCDPGYFHSKPHLPAQKPRLSLDQPITSKRLSKMIISIQDMEVLVKAMQCTKQFSQLKRSGFKSQLCHFTLGTLPHFSEAQFLIFKSKIKLFARIGYQDKEIKSSTYGESYLQLLTQKSHSNLVTALLSSSSSLLGILSPLATVSGDCETLSRRILKKERYSIVLVVCFVLFCFPQAHAFFSNYF